MKNYFKTVFLFCLILLLFSNSSTAQSKGKKANQILKEVTEKTNTYNSIKLKFTYRMENPEADIDEMTGGDVLVNGDKYRLNISGQTVISNGETIWTIISDAEEVQINSVDEGEEAFSPTKMLTTYSENYKSKLMPKITSLDGKEVYAINLIPDDKKAFTHVHLFIDKKKMQLYSIEIFDKNGSVYTYKITEFVPNVPLNAQDFKFIESDYPDFEVIDMR